jgi:hypothetical protein
MSTLSGAAADVGIAHELQGSADETALSEAQRAHARAAASHLRESGHPGLSAKAEELEGFLGEADDGSAVAKAMATREQLRKSDTATPAEFAKADRLAKQAEREYLLKNSVGFANSETNRKLGVTF